jgi:predicted metalloendopeptidase
MKREPVLLAVAAILALACALPAPLSAQRVGELGIDTTAFDRSIRPQDDFFGFVNGTWLKNFQLPADRPSYGTFIALREKTEKSLQAIVEEAVAVRDVQATGTNRAKVRDLYLSFMDTSHINTVGMAPIEPEQARIRAIRSKRELPAVFARLVAMGVTIPFSADVWQDPRHSDAYVPVLWQDGLGMPNRNFYVKTDARSAEVKAAYQKYIARVLALAGRDDADDAARRILSMENKLAEAHWDPVRNRDPDATYNRMTMTQLVKLAPGFDWAAYARAAKITSPAYVVGQPDVMKATAALISATPLEDIKTYLEYHLVSRFAQSIGTPFEEANFEFFGKTLSGQEVPRPRWARGIALTGNLLGEAIGEMYVEKNFDAAAKTRMVQLVDNLRAAFSQAIDELDWMSPATKIQAKDKLSKFSVKIAYPDKFRDYSTLDIRPRDIVGNLMRASQWNYARSVNHLGKPADRTEWGMTPQTVNAQYDPSNNDITFPAAILQPPFFNPNADDAVNYGAIVAVIGHEVSHGFDDQGRKSDGVGNLRDWWTSADAQAFEERANRLAAEYSSFEPVPGVNVNGKLTLGENIGDLSGLAVAYRAYRISLGGKEAPVIGGFTGDQRFFIGWAQVWRSKARDAALRQQLLTDPHSPGRYRTNGVLVNFTPFYEAFGVKPGDRMYLPEKDRIKIW